MRRTILTVIAAMAMILSLAAEPASKPSTQADDPWHGALAVEAKVTNRISVPGGFVNLDLRVVNKSDKDQTFKAMSCSWFEHWKCDSEVLKVQQWACDENGEEEIKLAPGQAWEKKLKLDVDKDAGAVKVKFKMGFTPKGSDAKLWSDELGVTLVLPQ